MALSDNGRQRVLLLCMLYVAQGLPWGFMVTALVSFLTQHGMGSTDAGWLTGIVLLPWTFKLVWGPVIDTVTIRSMGRRRPWIIGAQFLMAVTLLGILALGDFDPPSAASSSGGFSPQFIRWLGVMFFVHNCFASLQDVATDALAMDVLPLAEQGRVNGLMWGAKLLGKAIGAVVMAQVMSLGNAYRSGIGIPCAVVVEFVMLIGIMLFPICLLERPGEKRFPWSRGGEREPEAAGNFRDPRHLLHDLRRGFALVTTAALFIYGIFEVLGWGIVEVITKPLFTQQLGWDFVQFSSVSGGMAVVAELLGALAGGYVADRWGQRKVTALGFGAYGLMHVIFGLCPGLWNERWFTSGYLILNPGALAVGSVGFLALAMNVSWTRAAATMFTIFMTLSNMGHVAGNLLAGRMRDHHQLSYEASFVIAGALTLVPLALLWLVDVNSVTAKRAEPQP